MAVQPKRRHFTASEYRRMVEIGVLREDEPVELLGGAILQMGPISPRHAATTMRLMALFKRIIGNRAIVSIRHPIEIDDESEPQPDVTLLQPRDDFYASHLPTPADVLLLLEVSDSTLLYDRTYKLPLYANAGIVEVWIVDLLGEAVEVYREPANGEYSMHRTVRRGESIAPLSIPEANLSVDAILGH